MIGICLYVVFGASAILMSFFRRNQPEATSILVRHNRSVLLYGGIAVIVVTLLRAFMGWH